MIYSLSLPFDENIFEKLVCDLWNKICDNNSFQCVGRRGQKQDGEDIFGRNKNDNWIGIQCKWKSIGKKLTEKEIQEEVEKTKKFEPPLFEYYILTTAKKDKKLEKLSREITKQHLKQGLFRVLIWGWGDIELKIQDYRDLMEKYDYTYRAPESMSDFDKNKDFLNKNFSEIRSETQATQQLILSLRDKGDIDAEFQKDIDNAKALMEEKFRPEEAYDYLKKLKIRVWDRASKKSKYRILTNMGAAKIEMGELNESAYLLIEAYQYNKESEDSLTNTALGHLLLKEYGKAEGFLDNVLDKNPYNLRAHLIKIDLLSENGMEINDIIAQIPGHMMDKKEIAVDLAQKALSQRKFDLVDQYIERIKEKKDRDIMTNEILGICIIGTVMHKIEDLPVDMLKKSDIISLEDGKFLLEGVWDKYKNSEMKSQKVHCLLNIGIAESILGNNDKAEELFLLAKNVLPGDPNVKKNLGIFYFRKENFEKSIGYFEEINTIPGFEDVNIYLGQIYFKKNQFAESEKYLIEYLRDLNGDVQTRSNVLNLMVEIFSKGKKWSDADSLVRFCDNKIQELFVVSRILRAKGQTAEAIDKLRIAKKELTIKPMPFFTVILAIEFHQSLEFKDAIELFEKVADKDSNSEITQRLLWCYYNEKQYDKALEISKNLRQIYGPLMSITEIEINIYELIGDLHTAEELYKEFTLKFPKHRLAIIHYARLKIRLQKIDEAKTIVSDFMENFKWEELSEDEIINFASLLNKVGKFLEAVKLLYNSLKKFPNKQEIHGIYISLLLETTNVEAFKVEEVGLDTAVIIEAEKNMISWKIIENENPDVSRSEINGDNPLAKEMFGKRVGDRILFIESPIQPKFAIIKEIKHKYIFKLQEIMKNFETDFPSQRMLHSVQVDIESPILNRDTRGFDVLFNELDKRAKDYNDIIQLYEERRLPVGAVSNLLSKSPLGFFLNRIYKSKSSIYSCSGTVKERKMALSTLNTHSKLIADLTSITTMSILGIWEVVAEAFGKVSIVQETKDELYKIENEFADNRQRVFAFKENDKYFYHEEDENSRKESLEFLRGIAKSVEKYCEIIPCKRYLTTESTERNKWEEMLGSSFYKTVLITSEIDNSIHYSDDWALRELGNINYGNNGVWTQALLIYLWDMNKLIYEDYSDFTLKLLTMGFEHTTVDANILFKAAQKASWLQKPPFTSACELLNGKRSDESSLPIALDFLSKLWEEPTISIFLKNNLTYTVIDELLKGRNMPPVLTKLNQLINQKFYNHSFFKEINKTFKAFVDTHII